MVDFISDHFWRRRTQPWPFDRCVYYMYTVCHGRSALQYSNCFSFSVVSLGIHHLKTLRNILGSKELESKWHDIGLQLSIEPHVLERIELDHKDDGPGRLLTETLLFWLRENTDVPVSWQSLINILKSPSVKETNLASQIQSLVFESNHSEIDQAGMFYIIMACPSCNSYMYMCTLILVQLAACHLLMDPLMVSYNQISLLSKVCHYSWATGYSWYSLFFESVCAHFILCT